jgi:hypothetical protein
MLITTTGYKLIIEALDLFVLERLIKPRESATETILTSQGVKREKYDDVVRGYIVRLMVT